MAKDHVRRMRRMRSSVWHSRSAPLLLVVIFSLCSCFLFIWGLSIRSAAVPALSTLPLYPSAQALRRLATPMPANLAPATVVGLASPTITGLDRAAWLTNFTFRTSGTPEEVLSFYKSVLKEKYGFQLGRADTPAQGTTVLTFVRETGIRYIDNGTDGKGYTAGRDKEVVTVSVTTLDPGTTNVEVNLQPQPFVP